MGQVIIMPKQGLQMTMGMISSWLIDEGQEVRQGEPLFEMETDKLSITIDSTVDGTLLKILCPEGETAEVATPIAVVGTPGEDYQKVLNDYSQETPEEAACEQRPAESVAQGNIVIMPKQGLQMTEGIITTWYAKEGDTVRQGQPLFDMETDKLAITIDSNVSGTLLKILCPEGETAEVATPIAVIGEPGADYQAILSGKSVPTDEQKAPTESGSESASNAGRFFCSPRAKTRAEEFGIDYHTITGTGPENMVIERDVIAAKSVQQAPIASHGTHQIPLSGMRRTIARRMLESLHTLAQANHRLSVDMSAAVCLREQFKAAGIKISYNDIVLRCTAKALSEFPMMNATMDETCITTYDYVNIGMAIATDTGLLVPVIRDADNMTLPEISKASRELVMRTKENKLSPDELTGATFTISNLGMFDIESFTAVINKPEAGILAVGKIEKRPVVINDQITIRPMMELSLTYDHRILDGAPAAQFLRRVKQLLETPGLLI